ncbi:TPA: hypothetical protein ACH3X1_003934 [Trebouxia sp. C0004]
MHPKLGVSSAQLPAASVALPTTGGVSMTSAAAAALMHTSQLPSDTVAELATLAAAPSWSLQANPHQASRQLQLQKWPSASKAGTVAAPLSALLPNMPLQTPDKPLLPATGALFQGNSLQTNLSAQLSQQAGTAAATLHSPSSRLLSLHTSASASLEIPARVSPGSLPVAGALSPLGPAHVAKSSPPGLHHPEATLLSGQSQLFHTTGMSQTPHAQVSARPTRSMLVPPAQTAVFHPFFVQPQKISPLYASTPATTSAAAATTAAVPDQLPFAPAELPSSIAASRGTAARVCLPPLQTPPPAELPNPVVCATEAQGTATTVAPEPKPASAMPALGTPPPAILANPPLQAPIMSAAPAIPSPMRYSALKEGSAESPPRTSPSATVAMPVCITQVVCRMNGLMGPQQQMHHITEAQAAHLDEVFGDVEVLLDLASMDDKPLNRALRCDGKLNAVQIVSMRRLLRTILHQSNS